MVGSFLDPSPGPLCCGRVVWLPFPGIYVQRDPLALTPGVQSRFMAVTPRYRIICGLALFKPQTHLFYI